jgi:PEP-CTERM motif
MIPVATTTRAGVTITISQVGPDVVATGSGTMDTSDLTNPILSFGGASLFPSVSGILVGPTTDTDVFVYEVTVTGPQSFGPGIQTGATSGAGDLFGVGASSPHELGAVEVPSGYVSGTHLIGIDTYANQTFSSLGLTPGTYTWTWGTGAHADSLALQVGTAAAVPEPSTAILSLFGVAFVAYGWSRHRREQRRQAAA